MKRILFALAAILLTVLVLSCATNTEEATEVGTIVRVVYVRDLKTGKCIAIRGDRGAFRLADESNCKGLR